MGRNWGRRNKHRDDDPMPRSPNHGSNRRNRRDEATSSQNHALGPYRVTDHPNSRSDFSADTSFQRYLQQSRDLSPPPSPLLNPNHPRYRNKHNHSHHTLVQASRHVDETAFLLNSQRFKQFLVHATTGIVERIFQWYPDDSGSESGSHDDMDWQLEMELVIPQGSPEVKYPWDGEEWNGRSPGVPAAVEGERWCVLPPRDGRRRVSNVSLGIMIGRERHGTTQDEWRGGCYDGLRVGRVVRRAVSPDLGPLGVA